MEPPIIQPVLFRLLLVPVQQLPPVLSQTEQVLNPELAHQAPGYHPEVVLFHHVILDIHKVGIVVW